MWKSRRRKKNWTNQNFRIKQECKDDASGCVQNPYSKEFTKTTTTHTFTIKDNAGNSRTCTVDVYLDKSKPNVPTSKIRKDNSKGAVQTNQNKWTSNTLWWGEFKSTGSTSPIDHFEYSENCTGTKSGNLSSSYTYNKDKNSTYCIRAVNEAGTASNWSGKYYFKIDKTAPSLSGNITSRDNRFQSKNVYINLTASDNVTTAANLDMYISNTGYEKGGSWTSYKSQSNWTLPGSYDGSTKYVYVTVRDEVGHKTNKRLSYKVYKNCTTKVDNGGWYNKGSCSVTCGGGTLKQEKKQKDAYTGASCGVVTQNVACNTQSCIPTKPTINLHGYSSGSWTNQDVTITASSTSPSGIKRYEYQHGDNYWKNNFNDDPTGWHLQFNNNRSSMTIKIDWESSFDYSIRAVNNEEVAGPGSDMFSVNIDKTKPNCRAPSYRTWTAADRYVEGVCSDNGGSGCIGNASKYFNTTVSMASVGTVYDNAGNSSVCEREAVRVDKDAPYAPYFNYLNPVANISKIDYSCSKNDKKSSSPNICNATVYIQNPNSHCTYEWSARESDFGSGVSHSLFYFESNGIGADYCNWTEKCNFNSGTNPSYIVLKHKSVDKVGHIGPELIINFNVVQ